MGLLVVGINHRTAPVAVREKVAFGPEQMSQAFLHACEEAGLEEMVILSTCNRTEIYLAGENNPKNILKWLSRFHDVEMGDLEDYHYYHSEEEAVQHLMRVACGLDSMILGEPQILGQMKSAFAMAEKHGTISSELHSAFNQVFSVAKRVRSETAIGETPVSVAYAAVSLSRRIFSSFENKVALLIGAGKTIELVSRHLQDHGIGRMLVANRSLHNAQELAEKVGGEAIILSDIPDKLHEADIIISSTASQLPILGKGAVEDALHKRKHKPMFMVDIAVPRDIETQVAELSDVYLYTVDDLRDVIDENMRSREEAAKAAQQIIEQGVENYKEEIKSRVAVSTIKAYREQAETLRDEEIDKALKMLGKGSAPEDVIRLLARGLTNKLLHRPTTKIKEAGFEGRDDVIDFAQKLFELESKLDENQNK